ncbi:MAG: hypothetical protein IAF08_07720 [Rhizobacter sp.]|nr:hypothetical protein [Chlorobiales bacterium]
MQFVSKLFSVQYLRTGFIYQFIPITFFWMPLLFSQTGLAQTATQPQPVTPAETSRASRASCVELKSFYSKSLGLKKNYNIYLPAGYRESIDRYPVVYFLRGHEREWFNPSEDASRQGRTLKDVADSLIASGITGKMILVAPSTASDDNQVPALGVNFLRPDLTVAAGIGTGKFEDYLAKDLIGEIDKTYRTIPGRRHRGIDGFSLGGYTAVMMGVKHPELFSSVGSYDGTQMWQDLRDPRRPELPAPNDLTWLNTMFDAAFDSARNIAYMNRYNAANLILAASKLKLAAIRNVQFHIHAAAFDGDKGNIDRNRHIVEILAEKNISNSFTDIKLTPTATHDWFHANLHAAESLQKHWQTFESHAPKKRGRLLQKMFLFKK